MQLKFHWLEPVIIILVIVLSITTGFSATAPATGWAGQVDLPSLSAIAGYLAKIIIATITTMASIIWLLAKRVWKQDRQTQIMQIEKLLLGQEALIQNQTIQKDSLIQMHRVTSKKFDRVIGVLSECKTCTTAIEIYDNKQEHRLVLDSEGDHWTDNNISEMVTRGGNI